MKDAVRDKVTIITGASSGFGQAMAETFGEAGARLVLIARHAEQLQAVADCVASRGGTAVALQGDVTDPCTFEKALAVATDKWGRIDILINNAGGGVKIGVVEQQTAQSIDECLALNLTSVINACRIIVPTMKAQGSGLVINVSSACQKFAWPGWSVYSAAKGGLSLFSRCLHAEVRESGVAVTVLVPGGSNTGFAAACDIPSYNWDESKALRPEHIAQAALSVASLAQGAVVPEIVVYSMSQDITPF
jgi:NADP-dependent 3-hydroxy acid dehydrogenase YdfG